MLEIMDFVNCMLNLAKAQQTFGKKIHNLLIKMQAPNSLTK